jgi:hypothetical protein
MLKKSLALGVLAAFAMAPSAFADQVQGNRTDTVINAGNVGNGNVIGITNDTKVHQNQSKYGSPFYGSGNQVQGNGTSTGIGAGNVGYGNTTGINNSTKVDQNQNSGVYFPF